MTEFLADARGKTLLGTPRMRPAGASRPRAFGAWRAGGPDAWTCEAPGLRLTCRRELSPAGGGGCALDVVLEVVSSMAIGECILPVVIEHEGVLMHLDDTLRWARASAVHDLPELRPLVVGWAAAGGGFHLLEASAPVAARIVPGARASTVELALDDEAIHPRWHFGAGAVSRAAPAHPAGFRLRLTLLLSTVPDDGPPPVVATLPAGHAAAFVLTDHPDFDTTDLLREFVAGWRGRGLRLTKGAFALRSPSLRRPPVPTLDDHAYRAQLDVLAGEGSEVCPHGVNESGQVDLASFRRGLAAIAARYTPRTWIDHGLTLQYSYTLGGANPATYDLLAALREHGIDCLWSYDDRPFDPSATLDLLGPPGRPTRGRQALAHLRRGRPGIGLHYLRSAALSAAGPGRAREVLGHAATAARELYLGVRAVRPPGEVARAVGPPVRRAAMALGAGSAAVGPGRAAILARRPVLYPESGTPLRALRDGEPMLFATLEVVHTADAYHEGALARLEARRGLHVGHCYLLNRLPYLAGAVAVEGLSPAWNQFVAALQARVAEGALWNPTMGSLTAWTRRRAAIRLRRLAPGLLRLEAGDGAGVPDVTVLLPPGATGASVRWDGHAPAGWRPWPDWLAVWGALPAGRAIEVRW